MKSSGRRYSASVGSGVFAQNVPVVAITGDFTGGFVQVNTMLVLNPGAGFYAFAGILLDGVAQGPQMVAVQQGGQLNLGLSASVRVPSGRHRIGLAVSQYNGSANLISGYIDVTDTGA